MGPHDLQARLLSGHANAAGAQMNSPTFEWARVEAALDIVLDLPREDRAAALHTLADGDAGLRAELESLLAQVDGIDPVLDRPVLTREAEEAEEAGVGGSRAPGTRIGAYRLLQLIGRGGMGEVYRAERADGQYVQEVALKLMRQEFADQPERFQRERQTLARLDHPGIARLLDGGVTEDGRPYMVMELVVGQNVVAWCRDRDSSLDERLELFSAMCSALEYAHRNLVVHRDLKPANVLVTDEGAVKLVDFGIAKLMGADSQDDAPTQHAPMTPGYAAPEQLLRHTITTATDIYALGMLLFELLTGEPPWRFNDLSLVEGIDKVLRETPPLPSEFAALRARPPVAPRQLRGDFDAIVSKSVRKEPERRYESVASLRADIERARRHEPVTARDGARWYAMGRFVRRHRVGVASSTLVIAALLAGAAGVLWQARVATAEARRAEVANQKATAVKDFLVDIFKQSSLQNPGGVAARNVTAEQLLNVGANRIEVELRSEPETRTELLDTLALLYDDLGISDRAAALAQENLRLVRAREGEASLDTIRAETRLATALLDGGRANDAAAHLQAAQAALRRLGDRDTVEKAAVLVGLARIAYEGTQEEKQTGRAELRAALDIVRAKAPADPLHGRILDYLGQYAQLDEDYAGAERWFNALLEFQKSAGSASNAFAVGEAYLNLGDDQALMQHDKDADSNLRESVEILSAAAGPAHPTTALAKSRWGEMLLRAGRKAEAEPLLTAALEAQEKTPQGFDDVTETRKTLGALEYSRGRLGRAEQLMRENLSQLQVGQDKELRYGVSAAVLSTVLTAEGKLAEARTYYERSSDVLQRYIGAGSVAYAQNLVRGATLDIASGRLDDADGILHHVLTKWPAPAGEFPDAYVKAMLGTARVRLAQGRFEEARAAAADLLERIRQSPERTPLQDAEANALRLHGEAVTRLGRAAEAESELRRAVELRAGSDDSTSPWLAEARISLATCLIAQHRVDEATVLIELAGQAQAAQSALGEQYRGPLRVAQRALRRGAHDGYRTTGG
jgi:serine/threonine protein kinase